MITKRVQPLITIIVPAYNVAPWLPRCLDSIRNQTYKHLEILVINDGSSDQTGNIADKYATYDNRIKVLHKANEGLVETRELGIQLAQGEFVGFVDADDAVTSDMYERLVNNAMKYGADISHCGITCHWPIRGTEEHYGTNEVRLQDNTQGLIDLLQANKVEPSLCNKLYATYLMKDSCPDKSILNNEDLLRNFVLFSRSKKSIFEDFCGYIYYPRIDSMSGSKGNKLSQKKHIFRARKLIAQLAAKDAYHSAIVLALVTAKTIVHSFNYKSKNDEENQLVNECLYYLKQHRNDWHHLNFLQQIQVRLVIFLSALKRFQIPSHIKNI